MEKETVGQTHALNSRIIHPPVDGVQEIVVNSREVVSMHVASDARPPSHVHQTSSKLRATLALCKENNRTSMDMDINILHTQIWSEVNIISDTLLQSVEYHRDC